MENKTINPKPVKVTPNLVAVVFAVLCLISIFLPWFTADVDSMSMVDFVSNIGSMAEEESSLNLLYLLLLIPIFSIVVIGVELNKNVAAKIWSLVGRIIVVVMAAVTLYGLFRIQSEIMPFGGSIFSIISFGYWLMLVSAAAMFISLFYKPKND